MSSESATTIDQQEVARFGALADEWWNPSGPFEPLHKLNPLRVEFVRDQICSHFGRDPLSAKPLQGLTILDAGCGGGLLSEPLARLGAAVTGLDAAEENIAAASLHAEKMGLTIDYVNATVELLAEQGKSFDVVLAMEIIEHVADVDLFTRACGNLVKPNGLLVGSTISRTIKSLALAKIGAEYILRWLPRGTHDWQKFLKPAEFARAIRGAGLSPDVLQGVSLDPASRKWTLTHDLSVNYMITATKAG